MKLKLNSDRTKNPKEYNFRPISLEEAKALTPGQSILVILNNGKVGNARVNGKVKRWKREEDRIEIPCKYGLRECYTFTNADYQRIVIEM